jgi:hypothetical protein
MPLLLPLQLLPPFTAHHQLLQEEEDASDFTSGLSSDLLFYPPEHVLAGQYMFDDWDPALVRTASVVRVLLQCPTMQLCFAARHCQGT